MRTLFRSFVGAIVVCALACSVSLAAADERTSLLKTDKAWAAAAAAGDVAKITSYWADDAINYFSASAPPGGNAQDKNAQDNMVSPWSGEVQVHGALRAMLHEGQTGSMVTLDKLLPNPNLYALGALTDLAGEITILSGTAYLSYPKGEEDTRTELTTETNAGATLLVSTEVSEWRSVTTENAIAFEDIDEAIAKLAVSAGMSLDERFPFLLEGEFEDLQWHVIDGRRLADDGSSHADHLAASVQTKRERAAATLIGFYSAGDQGVFTHRGSTTHVHCVLGKELAAGHVDHVTIPAGTTVKFPTGGQNE